MIEKTNQAAVNAKTGTQNINDSAGFTWLLSYLWINIY